MNENPQQKEHMKPEMLIVSKLEHYPHLQPMMGLLQISKEIACRVTFIKRTNFSRQRRAWRESMAVLSRKD
jgi:hypothetical protein